MNTSDQSHWPTLVVRPTPRLLVVDDDVMMLRVLRRTFTLARPQWAAEFVDGGEAALEALENRSFDVLVTDLDMPRMNGIMLLEKVVKLYPDLERMVHSSMPVVQAKRCIGALADTIVLKSPGAKDLLDALDGAFARGSSFTPREAIGPAC